MTSPEAAALPPTKRPREDREGTTDEDSDADAQAAAATPFPVFVPTSTSHKDANASYTTDPAQLASMSRSERKRHREKKRRSDVNRGFEDLLALLVEVDAGVRHEVGVERVRRAQARGEAVVPGNSGSGAPASLPSSSAVQGDDSSLLSRVDLIDRATSVLKRVHRENEQRKLLIETLVLQGQGQQLQATTRSQIPFSFLSDSPELLNLRRANAANAAAAATTATSAFGDDDLNPIATLLRRQALDRQREDLVSLRSATAAAAVPQAQLSGAPAALYNPPHHTFGGNAGLGGAEDAGFLASLFRAAASGSAGGGGGLLTGVSSDLVAQVAAGSSSQSQLAPHQVRELLLLQQLQQRGFG